MCRVLCPSVPPPKKKILPLPPFPHPDRVLVGAPLQRGAVNKMGTIYRCRHRSGKCQEVPVTGESCVPPPKKKKHPKLDIWIPEEEEDGLTPSLPRTPGGRQHIPGLSAGYWGYWGAGEYGGGAWVRVGGGGL